LEKRRAKGLVVDINNRRLRDCAREAATDEGGSRSCAIDPLDGAAARQQRGVTPMEKEEMRAGARGRPSARGSAQVGVVARFESVRPSPRADAESSL
jgi:hypothetical protein